MKYIFASKLRSSKFGVSCGVHCDRVCDFEVFKMSEMTNFSFLCGLLLDVKLCDLEFNNIQFGDTLWFEGFVAR